MTASKRLPVRPSLESLRKQAKKLARLTNAGDADALARVRAHLMNTALPLTQRNAQLVIAREYGFPGWQDLTAEVSARLGNGLAWAGGQARRAIHDNDIARLQQLLREFPALLSWKDDYRGETLLEFATESFGDSFDPVAEEHFTRAAGAEALIDAGAIMVPAVVEGMLSARARGLLRLFERKGLLPHRLDVLAALGLLETVRTALSHDGRDQVLVAKAFVLACWFGHEAIALLLLDRCVALDPALGKQVDEGPGRAAFTKYFIENRPEHTGEFGLWRAFVLDRISRAILRPELTEFVDGLTRESWALGDAWVEFQSRLIAIATLNGRPEFITALLDLDPAILRRQPPPPTQAFEFAASYGHMELLPLLTRIWPLPDDLPYAAAVGNLARVRQWFDDDGAPALGDLNDHYPCNDARARGHLHWDPPAVQQVLDVALAFAVINDHFDVADFLLAHGADINTNWSSHEPASILHELVFRANYSAMKFLIDRGIDMTIEDYRWNATARGWARYAAHDEQMAEWLKNEEREQAAGPV